MKSFNEALGILENNMSNYQSSCKRNNKILSDKEAYLRNLSLFGKHYGGQTGFQRAEKFINTLKEELKSGNISTTEQLLDFIMNYPDKGDTLRDYIRKSVREIAGFTQAHSDYLIPIYQDANERIEGKCIETPSRYESREAIEYLFYRAIGGYYGDELIRYLGNYLGLESNKCADYGRKLLNYLNSKISEVELETISQHTFKKSA